MEYNILAYFYRPDAEQSNCMQQCREFFNQRYLWKSNSIRDSIEVFFISNRSLLQRILKTQIKFQFPKISLIKKYVPNSLRLLDRFVLLKLKCVIRTNNYSKQCIYRPISIKSISPLDDNSINNTSAQRSHRLSIHTFITPMWRSEKA